MKKPATKPKTMFGIRLAEEEREALEKAAAAEDRTAAYVARRAILAWLRGEKFLK